MRTIFILLALAGRFVALASVLAGLLVLIGAEIGLSGWQCILTWATGIVIAVTAELICSALE